MKKISKDLVNNYKVFLFSISIVIAGFIYMQMEYVDSAPPDINQHEQPSIVD